MIFLAEPAYPPSISESKRTEEVPNFSVKSCFNGIKSFLTNANWVILSISSGLIVGVYYALLTLLNQIIKPSFSDQTVKISSTVPMVNQNFLGYK